MDTCTLPPDFVPQALAFLETFTWSIFGLGVIAAVFTFLVFHSLDAFLSVFIRPRLIQALRRRRRALSHAKTAKQTPV